MILCVDLSKDQGQDSELFRGLYQAAFVLWTWDNPSWLWLKVSDNYRRFKFQALQGDLKGTAGRGGGEVRLKRSLPGAAYEPGGLGLLPLVTGQVAVVTSGSFPFLMIAMGP